MPGSVQARLELFGQIQVVKGMVILERLELTGLTQPLLAVLPNRRQNPKSRLTFRIGLDPKKALLDQRLEQRHRGRNIQPAQVDRALQAPVLGQHRESTKDLPFNDRQEFVTPIDRRAQGPLPGRKVLRTMTEGIERFG